MRAGFRLLAVLGLVSSLSARVAADSILFSTNPTPDGAMAMASRPGVGGKIEIEAADDFFTATPVQINSATFTGLLVPSTTGQTPNVGEVVAELYHIFPLNSTNPPSGNVPTRVNSPSDLAFDSRDSASNSLTFTTSTIASNFTAANSVLNGINKIPNQTTGGEGSVTGTEVQFNVKFTNPFTLPAGNHDFFVPQVQVTGGEFYWLSSARPIVSPGTPFPAGVTDLQAWIRNEPLQPDWLRVGTDIVGGTTPPTFNGTFTLSGNAVPEPSSLAMVGTAALVGLGYALRRKWATATTVQA
jgi:PEP-CTERM motif-containing protein